MTRKYVENGEAWMLRSGPRTNAARSRPWPSGGTPAVETASMKPGPLTALRIVEYSTSIAAAASGKMLADLGAEVIKVEPPRTGDPARYHGPFPTISLIPNAAAYSCISIQARHYPRSCAANRARAAASLVGRGGCFLHNWSPVQAKTLGLSMSTPAAPRASHHHRRDALWLNWAVCQLSRG